jgi:LysM repeat protein
MHWVSQRYAIKLDKLIERNLMVPGQEPAAGETIYLRNKRDVAPKFADANILDAVIVKDTMAVLEPLKQDTTYNTKVYESPVLNLETQKPVESVQEIDTLHEFKENLSFFHTVQAGETLYGIGKKYGVRVDAIMYLNLLQDDRIEVGQRLIINPAISSADTKEPQSTPGVHVVRQGETLFSIAKSYGLSVGDIKATNNLSDDQVYIGQKLVVVK